MFKIGCHLSSSNGYKKMGQTALSIDANTFQFFSRNPRGSKAKQFDAQDADELIKIMKDNSFAPLLAHAPYTLNPCSLDEGLREFATRTMQEDIATLSYIPGTMYNFHPGSHVGQGVEKGIDLIVDALNAILEADMKVDVLLETMSGKGSEVGSTFEEIAEIIARVNLNDKLGVCLDTCHVYSAGYDIVNNLDGVVESFDKIIGLNRLKAIHLNDSMMEFASHKDRHEKIGGGTIGLETVTNVINHPKLKDIPFFLETPNELEGYAEEITLLRKLYK